MQPESNKKKKKINKNKRNKVWIIKKHRIVVSKALISYINFIFDTHPLNSWIFVTHKKIYPYHPTLL